MDADDFLELNMYSDLLNKAKENDSDMVFCRIKRVNGKGEVFYPKEVNLNKILKNDIEPLFYTTVYANCVTKIEGVVWRTLFKTILIKNNYFNTELKYGEDVLYIASLILKSKKISVLDKYLYNYFTNTKSVCNLINANYFKNLRDYYLYTIAFIKENNLLNLKFLIDYGYLVRYIQNKIKNDNFIKEIKSDLKTDKILQGCLCKESYKKISKHESKKSVKIRNFLIYHKFWRLLKLFYKIKE